MKGRESHTIAVRPLSPSLPRVSEISWIHGVVGDALMGPRRTFIGR